tara:strand:+ start:2295 stop:2912 length:618 start_codon:yes stop_codon:yes gene_type:complete
MDELYLCKGGCKQLLPREKFGFNQKKKKEYKQCIQCREKKQKQKNTYEENITISNEGMDEKRKRENRPTISLQKQQIILKEQDYRCRGPGRYDNNEYECDMNVNDKRFCDKKSSEPQYDHILRWKEGGNGIENIQALCASCHLMKTSMENIMNESSECASERVRVILHSLTKPKYQEKILDSSDSDDDYSEILTHHRLQKYRRKK